MTPVGFIRSKNEIKYLILYITERLIAPVSFETLQELTMFDPAIEFFEFTECVNYLERTGHLSLSKDDLYAITEKGVLNGRACAEEIPFSVRLAADKLTEAYNQKVRRARQVQSKIKPRANGTLSVELRFNDDLGLPLWRLEVAVPNEEKANDLVNRFEDHPEKMYSEQIAMLFPPKEEGRSELDQ